MNPIPYAYGSDGLPLEDDYEDPLGGDGEDD